MSNYALVNTGWRSGHAAFDRRNAPARRVRGSGFCYSAATLNPSHLNWLTRRAPGRARTAPAGAWSRTRAAAALSLPLAFRQRPVVKRPGRDLIPSQRRTRSRVGKALGVGGWTASRHRRGRLGGDGNRDASVQARDLSEVRPGAHCNSQQAAWQSEPGSAGASALCSHGVRESKPLACKLDIIRYY